MVFNSLDRSIFEFALTHLQEQKAHLDAQIEHVRLQLGRPIPALAGDSSQHQAVEPPSTRKKRAKRSPEVRKRMGDAQRKRWAEIKKSKARK
jgi:hypothetical protein